MSTIPRAPEPPAWERELCPELAGVLARLRRLAEDRAGDLGDSGTAALWLHAIHRQMEAVAPAPPEFCGERRVA